MYALQTDYDHIKFVECGKTEKTTFYDCRNKNSDSLLGCVRWYPGWRRYVFLPSGSAMFDALCLSHIQHFLGQLMDTRKKKTCE
jgi:hypothetical protein